MTQWTRRQTIPLKSALGTLAAALEIGALIGATFPLTGRPADASASADIQLQTGLSFLVPLLQPLLTLQLRPLLCRNGRQRP